MVSTHHQLTGRRGSWEGNLDFGGCILQCIYHPSTENLKGFHVHLWLWWGHVSFPTPITGPKECDQTIGWTRWPQSTPGRQGWHQFPLNFLNPSDCEWEGSGCLFKIRWVDATSSGPRTKVNLWLVQGSRASLNTSRPAVSQSTDTLLSWEAQVLLFSECKSQSKVEGCGNGLGHVLDSYCRKY